MLIQFNFSNHKSFREEASLDLTATGISELKNHIFKVGKENILPVSVIYGANASGKSNVIEAFKYMRYYVMTSFGYDLSNVSNEKGGFLSPPYFVFDKDSKNKESCYEVYFIIKEEMNGREFVNTYNYGFTVDKTGIVEEWLNSKAKTSNDYKEIFYRNENKNILDLNKIPKKQRENIKVSIRKETLILSLGDRLKVDILKKVYDWFRKSEVIDFGSAFEVLVRESSLPRGFVDDGKVKKNVINYLKTFDNDIVDFRIEKGAVDEDGIDRYMIDSIHKSVDSDDLFSIPLSHESSGTLKMFSLYQYIMDVLDNGGVLFIDELNSRLHPIMLANIIQTFTNKDINRNGAQLIITTHDVSQLDTKLFRRDEIWFTKKSTGHSELYSLADFEDLNGKKIRKDENYLKNYLLGKYGAIPNIKNIELPSEVHYD